MRRRGIGQRTCDDVAILVTRDSDQIGIEAEGDFGHGPRQLRILNPDLVDADQLILQDMAGSLTLGNGLLEL